MTTPLPTPTSSAVTDVASNGITGDGWLTLVAAVLAALIAAGVALLGYNAQQTARRREVRAEIYSEALRTLDDYLEAPYRIRRRDGSAEARIAVTNHISDIQSRITYFQSLLRIHAAPAIASGYDDAVASAKKEAGAQMTEAWEGRPTRHDREVPIRTAYLHPLTASKIARLTTLMRADVSPGRDREPTQ